MAKLTSIELNFIENSNPNGVPPSMSCNQHRHLKGETAYRPGDILFCCVSLTLGEANFLSRVLTRKLGKSSRFRRVRSQSLPELMPRTGNKACLGSDLTLEVVLQGYGKTRRSTGLAEQSTALMHNKCEFIFDASEISIPQGSTVGPYNFLCKFSLPVDLPPSFKGKYGCIKYRLQVLDSNSRAVTKKPFRMSSAEMELDDELLDCVDGTSLLASFSGSKRSSRLIGGCFPFGVQSIKAEIDRRIYHFEGDVLALPSVVFNNDSPVSAKPVIKLVQRQTYVGRGLISNTQKRRNQSWILTPSADLSPLRPRESRFWTSVKCTLPSVQPSIYTDVIRVDYFVEISLANSFSSLSSEEHGLAIVSLGVIMANSKKLLECLNIMRKSPKKSESYSVTRDLLAPKSLPAIEEVEHESMYIDRLSSNYSEDSDDKVFLSSTSSSTPETKHN